MKESIMGTMIGIAIVLMIFVVSMLIFYKASFISELRERFGVAGKRRESELKTANDEINGLRQELKLAQNKIEGYKAVKTHEANAFRSFVAFETELLLTACKMVGLDIDNLGVERSAEYVGGTEVHRLTFDDGLSAELSMDGEYYIKVSGQDMLEDVHIGLSSDGLHRYTLDDVKKLAQYLRGVPVDDSTRLDPTMVVDRV